MTMPKPLVIMLQHLTKVPPLKAMRCTGIALRLLGHVALLIVRMATASFFSGVKLRICPSSA